MTTPDKTTDHRKKKVSVCMITYNHEKYIAQAIESALAQKTDFEYEIVIGDDASTDQTAAVIAAYEKKHPHKIRAFLRDHNLGFNGKNNFVETLRQCTGKYVALLEGDDYWTDPLKLQKQSTILDRSEQISICFHRVCYVSKSGKTQAVVSNARHMRVVYTLKDLLCEQIRIFTPSQMFRNRYYDDLPEWYYLSWAGDYPLNILNATHGEIHFIDEVMAAYRMHDEGVRGRWSACNRRTLSRLNRISLFYHINLYYDYRYDLLIKKSILRHLSKLFSLMIFDIGVSAFVFASIKGFGRWFFCCVRNVIRDMREKKANSG